jgi:hypothetical protein
LNPLRLKDGYPAFTYARLGHTLKSKLEDAGCRGYNLGISFWKEVNTETAYQAVKGRR